MGPTVVDRNTIGTNRKTTEIHCYANTISIYNRTKGTGRSSEYKQKPYEYIAKPKLRIGTRIEQAGNYLEVSGGTCWRWMTL